MAPKRKKPRGMPIRRNAAERKRMRDLIRKVARRKPAKRRKDVGCPNTHLRVHPCLTVKELAAIRLALKSAEAVRSTEAERRFLRKLIAKLAKQVAV